MGLFKKLAFPIVVDCWRWMRELKQNVADLRSNRHGRDRLPR